MDAVKVGKAIRILREKAGYTQKALADQLLVSDKAVSKWERGIGMPDISCLRKLSILLDTDTDTLLAGEAIQHGREWGGILLLDEPCGAGETVYDKPLADFLLSYFMLVGIKHIAVACCGEDNSFFAGRFGDGSSLGLDIVYFDGNSAELTAWAEAFDNCMLLTAPLLLFGVDMTNFFLRAMTDRDRTVCLCVPMGESEEFPPLSFDESKKVMSVSDDKKKSVRYMYRRLPLWFCPGRSIGILLREKIPGEYFTEPLNRGFIAISVQGCEKRELASRLVEIVQDTTAMALCDLREIAAHRNLM